MANDLDKLKPKVGPHFGRKKGTPNRDKFDLWDICKKKNINVFETLLCFVAADWKALGYESEVYHREKADGSVSMGYVISPEMRLKAALEAAKYLYPQKKAIEMSGSVEINHEERERHVEHLKELHSKGVLAIVGTKCSSES